MLPSNRCLMYPFQNERNSFSVPYSSRCSIWCNGISAFRGFVGYLLNIFLTNQQNTWNKKDTRGYWFDKRKGKYRAQLMCNGKRYRGKRRATAEEARADYLLLKEKHHIIPTSQEG